MKLNKKITISVILIVLITAGAYVSENIIKKSGVRSGGIIQISRNGKTAAYISDEVLIKLMEKDKQQDDEALKGPALRSALSAAGIVNYNEVEVKGLGTDNRVTLSKKNIDENLILYVSGNGKVDLGRKGNSKYLVTNVNEINTK